MIPKILKNEEKKENKKLVVEEAELNCDICKKKLDFKSALVFIDFKELISHTVCDLCIRTLRASTQIAFLDTFENYRKREKSGFIKQLKKELLDAKNQASSRSTYQERLYKLGKT